MLPRNPFKEGPFVLAAGNKSADSLQLSASSFFVSAAESCPAQEHAFPQVAHIQKLIMEKLLKSLQVTSAHCGATQMDYNVLESLRNWPKLYCICIIIQLLLLFHFASSLSLLPNSWEVLISNKYSHAELLISLCFWRTQPELISLLGLLHSFLAISLTITLEIPSDVMNLHCYVGFSISWNSSLLLVGLFSFYGTHSLVASQGKVPGR